MLKAELLVIFGELTPGVVKFNGMIIVGKKGLIAQLCVIFKHFIPPCLYVSCHTLSECHCVCKKNDALDEKGHKSLPDGKCERTARKDIETHANSEKRDIKNKEKRKLAAQPGQTGHLALVQRCLRLD